jgi:hypothetical protein
MSTAIQASTEIDLEDAAVARKQPKDAKTKESDRELAARLVNQARTEGVELAGRTGCGPAGQAGAGVRSGR